MRMHWIGLEALEDRSLLSAGPFHYIDADGDRYSVALRGPGTMIVVQDDSDLDGKGALTSIELVNTTGASKLIVKGATTVGRIFGDALGVLKGAKLSVNGAGVDLGADPGDKLRIALGSLAAGSDLTFAGVLQRLTLTRVESGSVIEAASAHAIRVKDVFAGSLHMTDATAAQSLKQLRAGALRGADIRTPGSIGKVVAQQAVDSTLFAGIDPNASGMLDSADDFVNKNAVIGQVTIQGGKQTTWLENTQIAAWKVGSFSTGRAQSNNGGLEYGLATNAATEFRYVSPDISLRLRNAHSSDITFRDGDMTLRFFEMIV